ncbi:MAG: 50S ribosomal protein L3 N(5)-glutamine methyltransferase [Paraglaciecola sp.]|uniref:50S ribosomal protein L3 N(5)-glutamine methyltransferase n=1 Tax=Paraglaciecola sp. TaxID=1920173 RepID=UPI00273D7DE3|nr:50S ribosomal protein L3 N(5)-glutamine methyltransferase [Paraglaciecola sp.]MDP5032650.1 50S ribosomal protein L3 N(5)-glutamine methyltransferase [Paraglaciecola sp.]MDP5041138.1 50S ribosomal protein L3 N(5)-glutamine methyltransferase [Paraglaciecola sp.]MDP5132455.1 50S ribosomal protein L3 N(5)-glutamine methyltransferase [Paraglaciecola sp.]
MNHQINIEQTVSELDTILDVVRWSVSRFNEAGLYYGHGTDNPWDEAVSLVLQLLHLPQNLPLQTGDQLFHSRLTSVEKINVIAMILRRVNERIPAAYLTNQAWFCDLPFFVDERVLIPRSPFAELIKNKFDAWLTYEPVTILDLCTGGGCIAIALAYAFENSQVDAVDISSEALDVAEININEHGLAERVFPIQSDLMTALKGQSYDLIVCNPPYVDAEDMDDLPDEYHHEPELALAAGEDGLDLVDNILRQAPEFLAEGGWLFVEVGNSEVHMPIKYPDLPITWVEFENGGSGIFAINKTDLVEYWHSVQH